jgi:hypothetical protein
LLARGIDQPAARGSSIRLLNLNISFRHNTIQLVTGLVDSLVARCKQHLHRSGTHCEIFTPEVYSAAENSHPVRIDV